jgi:dephospho-CoA kinase
MILGITGSVATGKSTVSKMFEKKGAVRLDADLLAREALEPGRGPYRSVIRFFGKEILREDRSIDRAALARIVFGNRKSLKALNARVHPYVRRRMQEEIRKIRRRKKEVLIVAEVQLLHENRLSGLFDKVITVSSTREAQKKRWVKKGMRLKDLNGRLGSQLPLSYKEKHSDFIIDNSGSVQETRAQVSRIWKMLIEDPSPASPEWKEKRRGIGINSTE